MYIYIYITNCKTYEICINDYSWIIHCRSKSSEAKNLKIRLQLFFLPLVCHPFILTKFQYNFILEKKAVLYRYWLATCCIKYFFVTCINFSAPVVTVTM